MTPVKAANRRIQLSDEVAKHVRNRAIDCDTARVCASRSRLQLRGDHDVPKAHCLGGHFDLLLVKENFGKLVEGEQPVRKTKVFDCQEFSLRSERVAILTVRIEHQHMGPRALFENALEYNGHAA